MGTWVEAAQSWHSPTRGWLALAVLLAFLLVGVAAPWSDKDEPAPRTGSRIEQSLAYLESCGEIATTSCPLQKLVEAAYNSRPRKGSLTIVEFDPATGAPQELSLAGLANIARAELSAHGFERFEKITDPSKLLTSSNLSKFRMIDVAITNRPSDLEVQTAIKRYLAYRRPAGNPVVMLIGDSIRMRRTGSGYGVVVYNDLSSEYGFDHVPHNTSSSTLVLRQIEGWLKRKPDLVLLNAGLHDLVRKDGHFSIPPEVYRNNLREIVALVRAHEIDRFALVLSTPVIDAIYAEKAGPGNEPIRRDSDVLVYNQIMSEVAQELGVPVVDLYQPLLECLRSCISSKDGVHLAPAGSERAAQVLVAAIRSLVGVN